MSDGGKGSKPRPFSVSNEDYAARWDAIFAKPVEAEPVPTRSNQETQEAEQLPQKQI